MTGDSLKISELTQETAENNYKIPCVQVDPSGNPIQTVYITAEDLMSMKQPDEVTVTSAQIKALFSSPKTLVAAPGAKKALRIIGITAYNDAGAAPYTSGVISIGYDTGQVIAQLSQAWAQSSSDKMYSPILYSAAGTDVENKPLIMWQASANPTVGTGIWYIKIDYAIHDFN